MAKTTSHLKFPKTPEGQVHVENYWMAEKGEKRTLCRRSDYSGYSASAPQTSEDCSLCIAKMKAHKCVIVNTLRYQNRMGTKLDPKPVIWQILSENRNAAKAKKTKTGVSDGQPKTVKKARKAKTGPNQDSSRKPKSRQREK